MKQTEMPGDNPESLDNDLLSLCALMRWFDHDLLRDLAAAGEDAIEALMASDQVEAIPEHADAYHLRDDVRAEALARLRAEHPHDELTLHTRIFGYFLRQMRESVSDEQRAITEERCLYHLDELFRLIAARREWQILAAHVAAVRAAQPQQPRHLHQIMFYEGYVAVRTQNYVQGEAVLTELLEQAELSDDLRVQILNALGQIEWFQTRYDRALHFYERVQLLAFTTGDRFYQAVTLTNMAMIYTEVGHFERAVRFATQGLEIFREIGDTHREAKTLYEIGNYAIQLGRWEIAQRNFQEAVRLYESLGIQAGLAYLYWGQGFLSHLLDDTFASEVAYRRALEISQSPAHGEPSVEMHSWLFLGFLYHAQGRYDQALVAYERSVPLATRLGNQHWLSLIHYRCGNVFARQGRLDDAFAAYAQAIDGIEALRGATETEEIKIGLLGTAQQVYESIVLLCLELDRPEEAFHYVERARARAFLDMVAKKQAKANPALYDALSQPVATLAEVQSQLRDDALLLEYFTLGVLPRGESLINQLPPENTRLREHLTLPPQTIIFAITRSGMEIFRPPLDPNTLRPQPGDPGPGRRLLRDRLLTHLHAQLITPAESLLRGRALLYIIPHGPLHYVPFMALRSAEGAHLLTADGPAIALAPSATVLLRNCLDRPPSRGVGLLALGYNDQGEQALRYAEAEAGHVARLAGGEAWISPAAKSAQLIATGRHTRWLHIAGHAIYNPHDPLGTYLQLGQDEQLSTRTIMSELELDADLVTLSACMSGLNQVMSGDELFGLQRAFLYAGAPAVVCTLWETADFVALLLMDRFYTALHGGSSPATALRDAQVALRDMTGRDLLATLERWRTEDPAFLAALGTLPDIPTEAFDVAIYADPFYWAPFMLIGKPD